MRCSNCGKDNEEGTRICPWCGSRMESSHAAKGGPRSRTVAVAVLVVVILAVAAVIAFNGMDKGSDYSSSGPDDSGEVTIECISGPVGLFDITYGENDDGDDTVTVTMNEKEADRYSQFTWYVTKVSGSGTESSGKVPKTEATATWTLSGDEYGTFTLSVDCINGDAGRYMPWKWQTTYSLTFSVQRDIIEKTYSWEYLDTDLTFTISYDYDEFEKYSGTNGASMTVRAGNNDGSYELIPGFVVINSTITEIESELKNLYTENFGTDTTGQAYAEFILAFVQENYSYKTDWDLYGREEYYAFPMETIFFGSGDCEDTSILCAALFTAAGYDAGVILIPGHAIAAVTLDDYIAGTVTSAYKSKVAVFSIEKDGKTYYGCETTVESNYYGIGYISSNWKIVDGVIYYQNKAYTDGNYGLYLVDSTA